jgi:hypothetical protein
MNCVRNEEVLQGVKEERNILHTLNRRKASRIGHILHWDCLLKHVIARKIEVGRGYGPVLRQITGWMNVFRA